LKKKIQRRDSLDINIGVVSLGCSKNLVDTEIIMGSLSKYGCKIMNKAENADVIIINTCGFVHDAKQESINTILEMSQYRTKGNCRALIVIGCLAERYKNEIYKEIPEVDAVVGIKQYEEIPEIIKGLINYDDKKNKILDMNDYMSRLRSTPPFLSYLKISEGCSNRCSYCVIPLIRGPYKSRTMDDIIEEAKHLSNNGVRELVIVAQDTTRYGIDIYGKLKLAELLKKLCQIEGIQSLRLLYAYPDSITDELVEVMATEDKICKYIDMPIQHISENMLSAMARKSTGKQIREVINKLRQRIAGITIRTTLIVGFPGETEEDFTQLLNFVEETRFDRLGVFTYSREEGTPAAKMNNQIHYKVKKSRQSKIMKVQKEISKSINKGFIGKTLNVLVEGKTNTNRYFGRTYRDAPEIDGIVYIKASAGINIGNYYPVEITRATQYDLVGGISNEPGK
jgi:ribosomal protein S12 methylthiotransferase